MNRKLLVLSLIILSIAVVAGIFFKLSDKKVIEEYGTVNQDIEIAQKDDLKDEPLIEKSTIDKEIDKAESFITIKKGLAAKWIERTFGIDASSSSETYSIGGSNGETNNEQKKETNYGTFKVKRVVDGDTFIISNNKKIRMLEIDTPESVNPDKSKNTPFGKVASKYTKKRLKGQKVTLKYDEEKQDKYGRELCYVYLTDGTFYNKELVEKGYAKALIIEPNTLHEEEILKAEEKAKKAKVGVWKE